MRGAGAAVCRPVLCVHMGVNYNLPKSENSRQPKCPSEKEKTIGDAHYSYFYKSGDKITNSEKQISFDEAIVALACLYADVSYAVIAKELTINNLCISPKSTKIVL